MIGGSDYSSYLGRKKRATFNEASALNIIAKYEKNEWFLIGNLKRRRRTHASIIFGSEVMVIGGSSDDYT